jgi:DNA-binding MarR family transcriptional regulator
MNESLAYLLHKLVLEMDRAADRLLRTHLGISYKRALFLFVLQQHGTITQHEEHGRKRLVTITPKGSEGVAKGRHLLDSRFDQLMVTAGVDAQHYRELTEQVYQALVAK